MIENTCQVCDSVMHVIGNLQAANSLEVANSRMEVSTYLSVGDWHRSYDICENCAKWLIAELNSFFYDNRTFTNLSLGELQSRMDSVARDV